MKLRLMLINAIEYTKCLIRYAIHVIQLPYETESIASIAKIFGHVFANAYTQLWHIPCLTQQ